ncbi:serine hydrolase domain-containing protein [Maribacter antarcticus]|uniref:serine hydrolase domain-containing protein n=1 Tax=Maribacter antarcticus TaxID=505250 RepID=UPI00047E7AA6|nr:serine hydrolase domain-containing protein [Maribacter antarcticus]
MKRFLKYFLIATLLVISWTVVSFFSTKNGWMHESITQQKTSKGYIQAVKEKIDEQFVGNFALAIMNNGVIESEVFDSKGKVVDRNTVFQVASLSKWVSAFGVMKLVEQGKLDLDAPVGKYLTRWQLPPSEFNNDDVTIRRLMSHTAGLTDGLGYSGFKPGVPAQSIEASLTKASDADEGISGSVHVGIEPGSAFNYSGGGYTLLQLLVEEVSGQSFASYMKETIFEPLNMKHSSYSWADSSSFKLAEFYNSDGTKAIHYRYTSLAATSLYTSLSDLEVFFQVFLKGSTNEQIGRNVLKPETIKMMRAPAAKTMGMDIWGLGTILYTTTENGDYVIGHDGRSTPPINTAVRLNPETGNGIIILETGNPMLATTLAAEWVFWKTGKVDLTLFTMHKDDMVSMIGKGWLAIIALTIIVGIVRRRKKKEKL